MASLKEMAGHRGVKLGACIMEFESPGIGHIYRAAGADFVFVDCEHSGIGIEGLKRILRYLEAAGMPHFVRRAGKTYPDIATALDAGAEGLLLPMAGSAEEVRELAGYMKYPPDGVRGVALGIAHDRYVAGPPAAAHGAAHRNVGGVGAAEANVGGVGAAEALAAANARTVCIPLIETAEGVDNVEAIAALPQVDLLWIGHFDLSCSLGVPGKFDHPDFVNAHRRIVAAAHAAGKGIGRLVGSPEEGSRPIGEGVDFICYGTDASLLQQAARAGFEAMRG